MLRGYGPGILEAVPRDEPASPKEIRVTLTERTVCRTPGMTTIHRHLAELVRLGCVRHFPNGTYVRLVDSEFDLPLEPEGVEA